MDEEDKLADLPQHLFTNVFWGTSHKQTPLRIDPNTSYLNNL